MIVFIIFMVFCFIYWIHMRDKRIEKLMEQFPGPVMHPIFGNVFNYFTSDLQEMKRRECEAFRKYGETFRVKKIRSYVISTSDPKLHEKILSNTTNYLDKTSDYDIMKTVLGNGLITSAGYQWYSHRKIIQPAFNVNILKQFIEIFEQQSKILVERLKSHCNGLIDVSKYVEPFACDMIIETSMGLKSNTQVNNGSEYAHSMSILKHVCSKRMMSYWRRFDILFSTFGYSDKRIFEDRKQFVKQFAVEVIESRRKILLEKMDTEKSSDENNPNKNIRMCFLDVLLQSLIDGLPLSNEEMLDEVQLFMAAGQDTVTQAISGTLFLLSRHKPVQDKLYAEIDEVFGNDKENTITHQQLADLKYMDMVIKESLRIFPAIQMIGRNIDHDLILDDGRTIPAGVEVRLCFGATMKSPKYFQNPIDFNPDRFACEETNPFTYSPFSAGKRDCVGKKYAIFSIKIALTRVLQHYELLAMGQEPIIQKEIISRSINGFQMALKLRTTQKN
ncbi:cytochrome P450 4d2-like [Sitodiplosis mosellana]|uniref:cytochrome P450 4d2-like n=1 Tax=Sitodiplosis mosellana TaxID=263140 RepID=UPI0024445BE7|nr:cytochrome P450 4d2-like [Sitodiplosis mosellana]